jgi:ankyrin repeat protein
MTRALALLLLALSAPANAQVAPGPAEIAAYRGLHAAALRGDSGEIERLVQTGNPIDARDGNSRTPLHVAVFLGQRGAARTLLRLGADANAFDAQRSPPPISATTRSCAR